MTADNNDRDDDDDGNGAKENQYYNVSLYIEHNVTRERSFFGISVEVYYTNTQIGSKIISVNHIVSLSAYH